jgi:peptidoglycan/xylan/chitin deacetylase (PgdA/CDA1 family)
LPVLDRLSARNSQSDVSLTFDDGPSVTTHALLDVLASHGAVATFFILGQRIEANPGAIEQMVAQGHTIYAHGYTHRRFTQLTFGEIVRELEETEHLLSRFRPTPSPYLVRLPHGSGSDHPRIHRALRKWNPDCQIARWTISTQDYELGAFRDDEAVDREIDRRVLQLVDSQWIARSIILLHEDPFGITEASAASRSLKMATKVVQGLASRGYEMVALKPAQRQAILSRFAREHRDELQLGYL